MNILICARCLTDGGAERVASLWAKGFCQRGHRVSMVLLEGAMPITYQVPDEVAIHKLYLSNGKRFNSIRIIKSIRSIIKKEKTDFVITVLHPSGMLTRLATIGMKVPVVFTDHNTYEWDETAEKNSKQRRFYKFHFNKLFSGVTVLTDVDRSIISKSLKHVYTLPNPLCYDIKQSVPKKEKIVLAAGRLDVWYVKGFDCLIKAWGIVAKNHPDWRLHIAGKGSASNQKLLEDMALKKNVSDSIHFLGFVNLLKEYERSAIFVLSSRFEGFGMVLTEAMSQGCAPIACDYKGRQSEIIRNKEEGIVCGVEDINALANAIIYLIENPVDRDCIQRNAIKRCADYQLDRIMILWDDIISDVLYTYK